MESILAIVLAVALSTERFVEVLKPIYLKVKKLIIKEEYIEIDKTEKIIMSIVVGVAISLFSGVNVGITYLPIYTQQVLIGLVASLGSNVIHTLINLLVAFKESTEIQY